MMYLAFLLIGISLVTSGCALFAACAACHLVNEQQKTIKNLSTMLRGLGSTTASASNDKNPIELTKIVSDSELN